MYLYETIILGGDIMNKTIKKVLATLLCCFTIGTSTIQSNAQTIYTTTANLNLRSGYSTQYRKLALIPYNTNLTILSEYNGWCKVKYRNITGWVSKAYLNKGYNNYTNNYVNNYKVLKDLIIVNKDTLTLSYYKNGYRQARFYCAIGKASTPTPNGNFTIINKEKNRPYYKKGIRGGAPNNPLGTRFLQLTYSGYAIHGTCYPSSIGTRCSDGCVRLNNYNVEWLYTKIGLGTHVIIGYGYNSNLAKQYGYKIY